MTATPGQKQNYLLTLMLKVAILKTLFHEITMIGNGMNHVILNLHAFLFGMQWRIYGL